MLVLTSLSLGATAHADALQFKLDGQRIFVLASGHLASPAPPPPLDPSNPGPPAEMAPVEVDVLVYYHGLWGYYSSRGFTNAIETTNLSEVVAGSDRPLVAILPEAKPGDADRNRAWQRVVTKAGGFERLVDSTLASLRAEHGLPELVVRDIAVAAHSGGGAMVGPSVAERGGRYHKHIREVTLLDAGYRYRRSVTQLKRWLLVGSGQRVLRILHGGSASAAYAVAYFSRNNQPARFPKGLRHYRGITAEARAEQLVLTAEALADFTLEGLSFDVLELTRGVHQTGATATWGSVQGKGHYAIRDAALGATARSAAEPGVSWPLIPPPVD
ncbi:MAG: hypothetical protein ACI9MR_001796 [Myxococcota bacterium]|jgi:hypothetical protein